MRRPEHNPNDAEVGFMAGLILGLFLGSLALVIGAIFLESKFLLIASFSYLTTAVVVATLGQGHDREP